MARGTEQVVAAIEEYAVPVLESMGIELVEIQFRREGHGWVLRLYIDKEGGVTLDDCASVSRELSTWLDVEDLIEQAYHLEVSSPGLERPLKKLKDFKRFSGRTAKVKLREQVDGQKVFIGTIGEADEEKIILVVDDKPMTLLFDNIAKARLVL